MRALSTDWWMLLRGQRGYWGGRGETRDVVYGKTQCANVVIDWSERNRR